MRPAIFMSNRLNFNDFRDLFYLIPVFAGLG